MNAFTTPPSSTEPALAAHGITKRFPGVIANDDVNFEVHRGEVHALLGENGSGKSTLCKILTGLYQPDEGAILVDGEARRFKSPADAFEAGVFMVHQHFSLIERMTVAENVALGWSPTRGLRFRRHEVEEEVAAAAERFQMPVDPRRPVWQLSVGERQRVEILKALYRGAKTLILDEPTTVLTPQEADQLFESVRTMIAAGESVVFISHKLHEVEAVCDRVTVLEHGRVSGSIDLREERVSPAQLASMMVGREIHLERRPPRLHPLSEDVALAVDGVSVANDFGREVVHGVSFDVRAGEIVALVGVAGNGQRELADAIYGLKAREGVVRVGGSEVAGGDVSRIIASGVSYVPEDRFGVGLAPGLDTSDNLVLKSFKSKIFSWGPFLRRKAQLENAQILIDRFNVKGQPDSRVGQLSGGNAQKVLLARELSSHPRVLISAATTRGLDVSAMETIRSLIIESADAGMAVLLVSEDLEEALDLADRVVVMCAGEVTGIVDAEATTAEAIGLLMMGENADQDAAT